MRLTHFLKEGKGIRYINSISLLLLILNSYTFGFLAGVDSFGQKVSIFSPERPDFEAGIDMLNKVDNTPLGNLVASKSGTRVYYVWCSGVSRIKAENKVFFNNLDEALKKGYKPASNCPGM